MVVHFSYACEYSEREVRSLHPQGEEGKGVGLLVVVVRFFNWSMIGREDLQRLLGGVVVPRDIRVYDEALTHRSMESVSGKSQERLEHLGDAVLQLCVTHVLFNRFTKQGPSELTRMRTHIVNGKTLAMISRSLDGIDRAIAVRGDTKITDRVYEDTFEALIGAVYLDLGIEAATRFVRHHIERNLHYDDIVLDTNHKDVLRKALAPRHLVYYTQPHSHSVHHTQHHTYLYVSHTSSKPSGHCVDDLMLLSEAVGASRRAAEMHASRLALQAIGVLGESRLVQDPWKVSANAGPRL